MKMIAHQDVGKNLRLVDDNGATQEVEKYRSVGLRRIDPLASIAAAGDVIVCVLVLDSKRPGHGGIVAKSRQIVKIKDLTPPL